jgi:hypothetical protein
MRDLQLQFGAQVEWSDLDRRMKVNDSTLCPRMSRYGSLDIEAATAPKKTYPVNKPLRNTCYIYWFCINFKPKKNRNKRGTDLRIDLIFPAFYCNVDRLSKDYILVG